MTELRNRLQNVFRLVFAVPDLVIQDEMDANSLEDWDSLQHINLIVATEKEFGIRFTTSEVAKLKQAGENIGTFHALLGRKVTEQKGKGGK